MARLGRIPFWKWIPSRTWRIVSAAEAADEIPEHLPSHGAVIVGSIKRPKWLAFDCPCGAGHRIMLTLDPAHLPHWVVWSRKKLSVSPSIDFRTAGRRCHFYITDGKIKWVENRNGGLYGRRR